MYVAGHLTVASPSKNFLACSLRHYICMLPREKRWTVPSLTVPFLKNWKLSQKCPADFLLLVSYWPSWVIHSSPAAWEKGQCVLCFGNKENGLRVVMGLATSQSCASGKLVQQCSACIRSKRSKISKSHLCISFFKWKSIDWFTFKKFIPHVIICQV